jgi:hypothetical protein
MLHGKDNIMRDSFNNIVQKSNEFGLLIEYVLNNMADTPKNFKLKKKVEAAYRTLKRALEMHESQISDVVPPLKVKTDDYPKEFIDTWAVYKDFLIEQFGIRMGSRMQTFRLTLLFELSGNDFQKASKWLKYYIASGSSNIYPVNDFKLHEPEQSEQKKTTAGFRIPAAN